MIFSEILGILLLIHTAVALGIKTKIAVYSQHWTSLNVIDETPFRTEAMCSLACHYYQDLNCAAEIFNTTDNSCQIGYLDSEFSVVQSGLSVAADLSSYTTTTATLLALMDPVNGATLFPLGTSTNPDLVLPAWPEPAITSKLLSLWQNGFVLCGGVESAAAVATKTCFYSAIGSSGWTSLPSMTNDHAYGAMVTLWDGRVWMTGGTPGDFITPNNSTEFLTGSGVWVPGPDLPAATCLHSVVQISMTQVLVIGGSLLVVDSAQTLLYDLRADTWTAKALMPYARREMACALVNANVICSGCSTYYYTNNVWTAHNDTIIYNVAADVWTEGVGLPVASVGLYAFAFDNQYLVVRGSGVMTYTGAGWTQKVMPNAGVAMTVLQVQQYSKP